jgi:HTH-type transcriptional regulator/antitoxin HigA
MMNNFEPDYSVSPGRTIVKIAEQMGLDHESLPRLLNITYKEFRDLLDGNYVISCDFAKRLGDILGGTKAFWLSREKNFRRCLILESEKKQIEETWLKDIPVKDIYDFYDQKPTRNINSKIDLCFNFFNVNSVTEWYEKYQFLLYRAAFRTSNTFNSKDASVVSWLRFGQIAAENSDLKIKFKPELVYQNLNRIKELTIEKDPSYFIPKLSEILCDCGVVLVIEATPSGCSASGATFYHDDVAVIILSFRYKTDDHFWFTLFHEIGHLVLHGDALHIESEDSDFSKEEEEANLFSSSVLIPKEFEDQLNKLSISNWRQIPRTAKTMGISTGILVGQLQHRKILKFSQLNKFKTRFTLVSK